MEWVLECVACSILCWAWFEPAKVGQWLARAERGFQKERDNG